MTEDKPLTGRAPRLDLDETFPARLVDPIGPGVLTSMDQITAARVALELLELLALRGGTRIRPSAIRDALQHLDRAVTEDVRAHCRDEAQRAVDWLEHPPAPVEPPPPADDLEVMHSDDIRSRVAVAQWALSAELELEIEWYEPENDVWPRERGIPTRIDDVDSDDALLTIETGTGDYEIPVMNIRWLMPVEPRPRAPAPTKARVLSFPGVSQTEEE